MKHRSRWPCGFECEGTIQRIGKRLDALIGQRLELEGKIGPTDEGSGGKRHFDGVFIGIGIAMKSFRTSLAKLTMFEATCSGRFGNCRERSSFSVSGVG